MKRIRGPKKYRSFLVLEFSCKALTITVQSTAGQPEVLGCSCWKHGVFPDCVKTRIQSPGGKEEQKS